MRQQLSVRASLGLPRPVRGCLFDLDGVLTDTARIHAAAWKQTFDAYLRVHAARAGAQFVPFRLRTDYDEYVDGRPRSDGVRAFLASRGIELPDGLPSNPPTAETVHGLGNRKNHLLTELIQRDGVLAYAGSVRYVRAARGAGVHRAVVSASANATDVLAAAGLEDLFEVCIDGVVAAKHALEGKPAPDMFLAAARALNVDAADAAIFEDALAGVEAGRAGNFGVVVGVDRVGHANQLRSHGADLVVSDLAELLDRS